MRLHWHNPGKAGTTAWQYQRGHIVSGGTAWGPWTNISCEKRLRPGDHGLRSAQRGFVAERPLPLPGAGEGQREPGTRPVDVQAWASISTTWTDRSHVVNGVTNGSVYYFRLRAAYRASEAPWAFAVALPKAVPAKPTGFSATAGVGEVRLKWKASNDLYLDKYQYRYKTDGSYGGWTDLTPNQVCTLPPGQYPLDENNVVRSCTVSDDLFFTVTGLTNDVEHTFQVRGVNSSGGGAASDEQTATPQAQPGRTTLTATAGDGQIALAWNKPAGADVTKWRVRYIRAGADWSAWHEITSSASTLSHTRTGLTNGYWHHVEVQAGNDVTWGLASYVIARPIAPLVAPTGLTATPGHLKVTLAWSHADTRITRWELQQKRADAEYGPWTRISNLPSTRSYTVNGLTNGVEYSFKLRALMPDGVGPASTAVTATPLPDNVPAAPANLAATARPARAHLSWTGANSVTADSWELRLSAGSSDLVIGAGVSRTIILSWDAPEEPEFVLKYEYSDNGGDTWTDICETSSKPECTTTTRHAFTKTLTAGTAYSFQVRATRKGPTSGGEGPTAGGASAQGTTETTVTEVVTPLRVWSRIDDLSGFTSTPVPPTVIPPRTETSCPTALGYCFTITIPGSITPSTTNTYAYTVQGLTNGTAYTFRVRAVNLRGEGAASNAAAATPIALPAAPSGLTALSVKGDGGTTVTTGVRLHWKVAPNTSAAPVTGYQYRVLMNGEWRPWQVIDTPRADGPNGLTVTVDKGQDGLPLWYNESYRFQVRAVNGLGGGPPSNTVSLRYLEGIPNTPTLVAARGGNAQARLSWSVSASIWIDAWEYTTDDGGNWHKIPANSGGYTVCRDTDGDPNTRAVCTDHATPSEGGDRYTRFATITGLTNGTSYTFKLRSRNDAGDSVASNPVTTLTIPRAPASFTATAGDAAVSLAWTKSGGDATVTGWQYRYKVGATGQYTGWIPIPDSNGVHHVPRRHRPDQRRRPTPSSFAPSTPPAAACPPTSSTASAAARAAGPAHGVRGQRRRQARPAAMGRPVQQQHHQVAVQPERNVEGRLRHVLQFRLPVGHLPPGGGLGQRHVVHLQGARRERCDPERQRRGVEPRSRPHPSPCPASRRTSPPPAATGRSPSSGRPPPPAQRQTAGSTA